MRDVFAQLDHRLRLEWGPDGAAVLGGCRVLVVVDVLSFSTAVDVAVGRGAAVRPLRHRPAPADPATDPAADPAADAAPADLAAGTVLAGRRSLTEWSLSPASLRTLPAGTRFALPSPNGATIAAAAAERGATVLCGCLRNASAVAGRAAELAGRDGAIGVVPAGERWPGDTLRPAVEDLIGAGAVVAALLDRGVGRPAPEAVMARAVFDAARPELAGTLASCSSGRELATDGFAADVELAAEYDVSAAAPLLAQGWFTG